MLPRKDGGSSYDAIGVFLSSAMPGHWLNASTFAEMAAIKARAFSYYPPPLFSFSVYAYDGNPT